MQITTQKNSGYEQDFYAWTQQSAELIRQRRFNELDLEHLAEELESLGRSDKRELNSRLAILLAHLLKWQYQSERRCNSWRYIIEEQRYEVNDLLEESPSLKREIEREFMRAYQKALLIAVNETGFKRDTFPKTSGFTLEQVLSTEYLPD